MLRPLLTASGKPVRMSPSALDKLGVDEDTGKVGVGCLRKWFLGSVLRVPGKESAARDDGKGIHAAQEELLLRGSIDIEVHGKRYHDIAMEASRHYPGPFPLDPEKWAVEDEIHIPQIVEGIDGYGLADLRHLQQPLIDDLKTTSSDNFYWSLTMEELASHSQMPFYAYGAWRHDPPSAVFVRHINARTRGTPKSYAVSALIPWARIEEIWHTRYVPGAELMKKLYLDAVPEGRGPQLEDAARVPYGPESICNAYGGCPFWDKCADNPEARANRMVAWLPPTPATEKKTMNPKKRQWMIDQGLINADGSPKTEAAAAPVDTSKRENQGNDEVIAKVADMCRPVLTGMGFVPCTLLESSAESAGVWPYEVLEVLGLAKDGDRFVSKPEEPESEREEPAQVVKTRRSTVGTIHPGHPDNAPPQKDTPDEYALLNDIVPCTVDAWKEAIRTAGIRSRIKQVYIEGLIVGLEAKGYVMVNDQIYAKGMEPTVGVGVGVVDSTEEPPPADTSAEPAAPVVVATAEEPPQEGYFSAEELAEAPPYDIIEKPVVFYRCMPSCDATFISNGQCELDPGFYWCTDLSVAEQLAAGGAILVMPLA